VQSRGRSTDSSVRLLCYLGRSARAETALQASRRAPTWLRWWRRICTRSATRQTPRVRRTSCFAMPQPAAEQQPTAGPVVGAPRFLLLFCGTQFGWAAQLPHLFLPNETAVLRVPSFHVYGEADPFKPTVRAPCCHADVQTDATSCRARCWRRSMPSPMRARVLCCDAPSRTPRVTGRSRRDPPQLLWWTPHGHSCWSSCNKTDSHVETYRPVPRIKR
jgi:hypothetical protein